MTPRIRVLATGGTIASTAGAGGATPSLTGDDLVDAVGDIEAYADIEVERVCDELSFHLGFDQVADLARAVERAAADGIDGIVVTHGTDTMEESAYYLDLVLDVDVPVVFTGAQRPADAVSADGPANLLAAIRTAGDDRFERGVYVAFGDRIHAARWVTKSHTSAPDAYTSPGAGPVGELTSSGISLRRSPRSESVTLPAMEFTTTVKMLQSGLDVEDTLLRHAIVDGVDGVVLAASGIGNTSRRVGDTIDEAIERGLTIALATRCYRGEVAPKYGGSGGSYTLHDHGVIPAGGLPPWKARIKLGLALSVFDDEKDVREVFRGSDHDF